jgi:LuxR family maltose regulon positive regulatory protein
VLEIRMLQALAHHAGGARDSALEVLGRAMTEAPEPESHVRLFLDEGTPMLELLADAADRDETVGDWARRLLERVQPSSEGRPAQPAMADPLSQREIQVLRLLDSELTGPQIADELYVSLNTLRTHTKRIFTKLDVKTRAAAVRSAHEHGLI